MKMTFRPDAGEITCEVDQFLADKRNVITLRHCPARQYQLRGCCGYVTIALAEMYWLARGYRGPIFPAQPEDILGFKGDSLFDFRFPLGISRNKHESKEGALFDVNNFVAVVNKAGFDARKYNIADQETFEMCIKQSLKAEIPVAIAFANKKGMPHVSNGEDAHWGLITSFYVDDSSGSKDNKYIVMTHGHGNYYYVRLSDLFRSNRSLETYGECQLNLSGCIVLITPRKYPTIEIPVKLERLQLKAAKSISGKNWVPKTNLIGNCYEGTFNKFNLKFARIRAITDRSSIWKALLKLQDKEFMGGCVYVEKLLPIVKCKIEYDEFVIKTLTFSKDTKTNILQNLHAVDKVLTIELFEELQKVSEQEIATTLDYLTQLWRALRNLRYNAFFHEYVPLINSLINLDNYEAKTSFVFCWIKIYIREFPRSNGIDLKSLILTLIDLIINYPIDQCDEICKQIQVLAAAIEISDSDIYEPFAGTITRLFVPATHKIVMPIELLAQTREDVLAICNQRSVHSYEISNIIMETSKISPERRSSIVKIVSQSPRLIADRLVLIQELNKLSDADFIKLKGRAKSFVSALAGEGDVKVLLQNTIRGKRRVGEIARLPRKTQQPAQDKKNRPKKRLSLARVAKKFSRRNFSS